MKEKKTSKGRIIVEPDGPYRVEGEIPLVKKTQIVSEFGEPLNWQKDSDLKECGPYELCRCGHSSDKPFCDNSHFVESFDGTETADENTFEERRRVDERGKGIVVKSDFSLCMNSGFCGNRNTNIRKMTPNTAEPAVRAEIMAMIDRCPSGTYTYSLTVDGEDVEADLPVQIAQTVEITSEGPIEGPLWVTGYIPVERSDGKYFETRNRVTLCSCGHSKKKPLCDGTHRREQEEALRKKNKR
ncbi:MAG TPA: CDGSH iron-sulfur domain-containing protein [Anaerolineaceae bacterium]|nr:CDGSH iron-sulfur domain-containing protein [Anaerolineaceae bacterium]HOV07269.1 CDGSH iron-sulfur domain-containing protein [Anaerolineaceae bacterium]